MLRSASLRASHRKLVTKHIAKYACKSCINVIVCM